MPLTVFRSILKPDAQEDYAEWAARMSDLARSMPGYVAHKSFTAPDGERVTLAEFDSPESQSAWARHPEHREAMKKGRADFYAWYRLQVCDVVRDDAFTD